MDDTLTSPPRPRRMLPSVVVGLLGATALSTAAGAAPAAGVKLELARGDHICIVGNTLADRMQHDGWLETLVQARFPGHDLVIRDIGFSGDELTVRLRSAGFGSPDDHLASQKAGVILAFFGYNESFAGAAGLDAFRKDLDRFLRQARARDYSGRGAPRVVLFSPIAQEPPRGRNLPDPASNNGRLELYSAAMAEVARADGVAFVDLFRPSLHLYEKAAGPLTINGIHLNDEGNRQLAEVIADDLFGAAPMPDARSLERLREAVLDKNRHWFNRHRTVDGYSIYGGRADLSFVDGQTNRVVMGREMEVLDVMTANRDRRIWAIARGGDLKVDDANTPPFIPVATNKPGAGPNGMHVFLGGEEAIARMTVGRGLNVNLFASEETFPELAKPVQMSFDARGRLWVAAWPTYPHWKPKEPMNDKILILEDTDGDGKADRRTVFADGLHCPTGFEFADGGVLVAQAPDLVFLKDTDGDDRADVRSRILSGIDSADTHHTANSFQLDPGGALYFQEGTFHQTQVETPYGPPVRCSNAGVFRYEPKTQKFEVYISHGFANPHGHAFDRWGQDIVVDGTGSDPYHATLFSGRIDYPSKHDRPPTVYRQRTRPCPGVEFLASRHFPDDFQGNLLVPNVIGFQGILRYKVEDKDSTLAGTELEPILSSTDPNFRPSDIEVGPDGAIYFLDWQNPIIGHMQHNLRDPSRDRAHGRVYRVTHEGRPLSKPAEIAGRPIEALLDLLKDPEDRVRYRAKVELGARDGGRVVGAVTAWVARLDPADPAHEHHLLEALWARQYHDAVDIELLDRLLRSRDFRARAAATRVLCAWRDRVPDALDRLKALAADPYPRVRLEAVRAASFFDAPGAVEVPLISAEHPADEALEFTRGETMRALEPSWRKAIADGRPIEISTEAGARFFLGRLSTDELLRMKRSRGVDLELLGRPGVREEARRDALADLSERDGKPEVGTLLDAIRGLDERAGDLDAGVIYDLARLLCSRGPAELAGVRGALEALATGGRRPVARQVGFLALIAADAGVDRAWALASRSVGGLRDLLDAVPSVRDPSLRAALHPRVSPLLDGLPPSLAGAVAGSKGTRGRYVRVELAGRKTLTLAEVEVFSDGRNVAPLGRASQKNMAYGGDPSRGIDGNKDGSYGAGGQTHTEENTTNPWWEVDLGSECPIESIVVYNRTESNYGKRLDRFGVRVLDGRRETVFQSPRLPAPERSAAVAVGGIDPAGGVRRAAINALVSARGHEAETFRSLARLVRADSERGAAIAGLLRIPPAYWPPEETPALLDSLIAQVRTIPARDRTSPTALDALQLADALASTLPADRAGPARKVIGELGVRVIRLGTVADQMLFDKDRLAAAAGRPVEILFENGDIMPHNFVVTRPGALEEVGLLGESTATQPDASQRQYVPPSDKILAATRLLAPRDSQRLSLVAPSRPGVYPYVCTYPGHWRRMYGAFYVVDDLGAFLADPTDYLASHPLPILDELLKANRPRKEWAFDDLGPAVEAMAGGRSFGNGRQMFAVASCAACHRLNGAGEPIGPDLTKLDPKTTRADLLRHILEPSAKVDEKYRTNVFTTRSGRTVAGMVVEEDADRIKVVENPLAKAEPVVLDRKEIEGRATSPTSIMPKGLLDKLSREEILDLVAYLAAKGEADSPLFRPGPGHGHGR